MPKQHACVIGKYVCMMKAVHLLLIVSIKSTAVFGEPCTSLDELTYDCLSFFDAAAPAAGGQQGKQAACFCLYLCFVSLLVLRLC